MFRKSLLAAAAAVGFMAALAASGPAKAATYDFNFATNNFTGSGQFFTDASNDVVGISGSIAGMGAAVAEGGSINGLLFQSGVNPPAQGTYYSSSGNGWNYDNVIYPGAGLVDNNGVLFSFGPTTSTTTADVGNLYSVANGSGGYNYYFSVDRPSSLYNPGDHINAGGITGPVITAAVPEPATWAMMLLGFCGLGFMAYRRRSTDTSFRLA